MCLEQCQILSTSHRVLDGKQAVRISKSGRKQKVFKLEDSEKDSVLYNATHVNHPSTVWARQSSENYLWLLEMTKALLKEYEYRYGKHHACNKLIPYLSELPKNIKIGSFTEPTPAMPDEYKVPGDSIQSYRNYYNGHKRHLFAWKKREIPEWIKMEPNK